MHGQAFTRLSLVALVSAIVISLVAANNFKNQHERETAQKLEARYQFFAKEIPRIEDRWQSDADHMKSRIEFSRILEDSDGVRWPKFTAFLNAQSEFINFSNLLIANKNGQIVFRYGSEAVKLDSTPAFFKSEWFYSEEARELYRVYKLPIWLGVEGQGTMLLLKSVTNAELKNIATPDTHLFLYFNDTVLASSDFESIDLIRPGLKEFTSESGVTHIQTEMAWPGEGVQPTLILQSEFESAYPLKEFLLRPLVAVLLVNALIWIGLGRWLNRTVHRIESLDAGTNEYGKSGNAVIASAKFRAAIAKEDEISGLAKSMDTLMHDLEGRNQEQKAYLETLSLLEEAVVELSCEGQVLHASAGWNKLVHREDAVGKPFAEFIHTEDRELMMAQCKALANEEKSYTVVRLRLNVDSNYNTSWLECRFLSFHGEDGKVAGVRGVLRDITQTYLHEKQITHMALHDALTGLPNRVLLEDRIKISLRQASRTQKKVGVCFIDMDHFKNVNDTLGHSAGDKLLLAFAERLTGQLRVGDTVARWGGDEFVVLLPDMDSEQSVRGLTEKISEAVRTPLEVDGSELVATFSMGVALYPDDGEDVEALFSQADRAMFVAKAQGRNQVCFYRDMTTKGIGKKELYIQNRLANAINANLIQAWFQPVVSAETGRCSGVEVLARWHDEEHGWISPATFIPMAENLGLINELGHQILLSALSAAQHWQEKGLDLHLAVNVSRRQLFASNFTERLLGVVKQYQVKPEKIILEITESIAQRDAGHSVERLQELKRAGFRIAIDDFGTGYSSLSQLHEMHVDELKVDISFVRRLHEASGLSMTQAIINLAEALNLETVAEGVETLDAAVTLKHLGVNYFQGYYFAKPMPLDEFNLWIKNQSSPDFLLASHTPSI